MVLGALWVQEKKLQFTTYIISCVEFLLENSKNKIFINFSFYFLFIQQFFPDLIVDSHKIDPEMKISPIASAWEWIWKWISLSFYDYVKVHTRESSSNYFLREKKNIFSLFYDCSIKIEPLSFDHREMKIKKYFDGHVKIC